MDVNLTQIQNLDNVSIKIGKKRQMQSKTCNFIWLLVIQMYLFTYVVWEVGHHSDVIHIGLWGGVEQNRAMDASVVEEIKVDVLHKEAFGIPGGQSHATVKQTMEVLGPKPSSPFETYLVTSLKCWMVPGGSVSRVRVLLTAIVILHGMLGSLRSKLPISASKGRWPPLCSVTFTPFTHCNPKR